MERIGGGDEIEIEIGRSGGGGGRRLEIEAGQLEAISACRIVFAGSKVIVQHFSPPSRASNDPRQGALRESSGEDELPVAL